MALSSEEIEFCRLHVGGMDAAEAAKKAGLTGVNVTLLVGRPDIRAEVKYLRNEMETKAIDDENVAAGREVLKQMGMLPADDLPGDDKLLGLDDVQQLMQKALKATAGKDALARENSNLLVAISKIAEKREDRKKGDIDIDKVTDGGVKRLTEPELRAFVQGMAARMKRSDG